MKTFRRILIALLLIAALLLAGVFAVVALDSVFGAKATDFTNVTYTAADGTTLHGYLAQPPGTGPFPAVLMVHEWWGLNDEITEMAEKLAAQGYVVLAPDTYRGQTTSQVPRALFLRLTTPADRVDADMQAAFDYVAALDTVDADRIAVMGFCYGGGVALRHGISNPALAATINLYGDTVSDPAAFGALLEPTAGPVLGIFGADDAQIPVEEARAFEGALNLAGIVSTVTIYPGVGHAFVNAETIAAGGAAADAWAQILAFLGTALR
jgi:carboxymethylenebutenolidase